MKCYNKECKKDLPQGTLISITGTTLQNTKFFCSYNCKEIVMSDGIEDASRAELYEALGIADDWCCDNCDEGKPCQIAESVRKGAGNSGTR